MSMTIDSRRKGLSAYLNLHTCLILFCSYAVFNKLYTVGFSVSGWGDRAQFFGDGDLRPGMVDFIFNEVMIYYLLLRVIAYKFNIFVCFLIVISSFAYYTRVPIMLLVFALAFSNQLSLRKKLVAGSVAFFLSFVLIYIRVGDDLIYGESSSIFYLTYPFIGVARLLQTTQSFDVNGWHYATLLFKPLDALMFMVDYLGGYGGQLSAGRYSGLELSQFEYIQSLQGSYNAFGSILYPFVYIAGRWVGIGMFIVFLAGQYALYVFATQSPALTKRFLGFLLVTGVLFSWTSPFVWMTPFIFTKFRGRRDTGRRNAGRADPSRLGAATDYHWGSSAMIR